MTNLGRHYRVSAREKADTDPRSGAPTCLQRESLAPRYWAAPAPYWGWAYWLAPRGRTGSGNRWPGALPDQDAIGSNPNRAANTNPRISPVSHERLGPAHLAGAGDPQLLRRSWKDYACAGSLRARGAECAAQVAWPKTRQRGAFAPSAARLCQLRVRLAASRTRPLRGSAAAAAGRSGKKPFQSRKHHRHPLARIARRDAS